MLKPLKMGEVPLALEWLKHLLDSTLALNFAHFLAVASRARAKSDAEPGKPGQDAGASVKVQVALVATPTVRA